MDWSARGCLPWSRGADPGGPRSRRSRSNIYELTVPTLSPAPQVLYVNGMWDPLHRPVGPPEPIGLGPLHRPVGPLPAFAAPQCGQEHDDQRPYRICLECVAAKRWPTVCASAGER